MSREVKRVPMTFDWPLNKQWAGYCMNVRHSKIEEEDVDKFCALVGMKYLSIDPPNGDGWQLWETVSEGSPITPVFATAEELAKWCADNQPSQFNRATYDEWLAMIRAGWCMSGMFSPSLGYLDGVRAIKAMEDEVQARP